MAGSKKAHHGSLMHLRDQMLLPARTPGILGANDAGDPTRLSLLGDTPGPTGVNDHGYPDNLTLPGFATLHSWSVEAQNHLEAGMQIGHYYPAGEKDEVLDQAYDFILKHECPNSKPPLNPCVPGAASGITIGVGYDLGQHTEKEIRRDWADLDKREQPPNIGKISMELKLPELNVSDDLKEAAKPLPSLMPPESKLLTPLDRLAFAARMSHAKSLNYLEKVVDIAIPADLALKVFKDSTLPSCYKTTARIFWGFVQLPTGVQVALLDLVYNRGESMTGEQGKDDILDKRWEMRELKGAILQKDLVWIYFYFESMRRVWMTSDTELVGRRDDELALIFPYVIHDIKHEAVLQGFPFK